MLWPGMWHHPQTRFHRLSHPLMNRVYRSVEAIVVYGEQFKRFIADTAGIDPNEI